MQLNKGWIIARIHQIFRQLHYFGEVYFPEVKSMPTAAKAIIAVPDHPSILR